MSSPETLARVRGRSRAARTALAIALSLGAASLAGCQVRPLYADLSIQGESSVQDKLRSVAIASASDRKLQQFRKELMFRLYGGGEPDPALYDLAYTASSRSASLAVPVQIDEPSAVSLDLSIDFILSERATGLTLLTGTSFASATYDYSSQRFANTRAQIDAENRVAKAVAQDVGNRLAAYFAVAESK
ncbi:hypothetical protein [Amorphus sp. 3PC139-8]|uniref:hypothetical protein n=1 Tax=Amorphus sp. 3PC139-8 TaxID=2735676 RepID=UPI00345D97BE